MQEAHEALNSHEGLSRPLISETQSDSTCPRQTYETSGLLASFVSQSDVPAPAYL